MNDVVELKSMSADIGGGLMIIALAGCSQVSVDDGKIMAGDNSIPMESVEQLNKLGWYYDMEIESFVYDVLT